MDIEEARFVLGGITLDRLSTAEIEALSMAIKALEMQRMDPVHDYGCPNCGCDLICNLHLSDLRYCPHCGKRLGWKEDYE